MAIPGLQGVLEKKEEGCAYWLGPIIVLKLGMAHCCPKQNLVSGGKEEGRMDIGYVVGSLPQMCILSLFVSHTIPHPQRDTQPPESKTETHLCCFPLLLGGGRTEYLKKIQGRKRADFAHLPWSDLALYFLMLSVKQSTVIFKVPPFILFCSATGPRTWHSLC